MKNDRGLPLSIRVAKSVENRYRPGMMQWHYEHGLVLFASISCADYYEDRSIYPWVYSMYDPIIKKDGTIISYREGEYNLDQINAGKLLFTLFDRSGEDRFLLAQDKLKSQLIHHPRTKSGVFWHKAIYPWQIWLDGLYMSAPFSAEYAKRHNDIEALDDVAFQLIETYRTLKDEKTGLLYHAYDESRGQRWSDINTGLSPHFWSRSIGWYAMAVLDALDFFPDDHIQKKELENIIKNLANALIPFQDVSGMWYQVPDYQDAEGNYLETSGSAMFAYLFFKGVRKGILDESAIEYGKKALDGIKKLYLKEDEDGNLHLDGICSVAGLGGNPYRDGSLSYYFSEEQKRDDFKGVGAFILAVLEEERASQSGQERE
ncbi:MAG: glycoside hydrolase family 88 protein [Sphaerochaetaceae bacterium]|nr:glycoside hydrolase family 88 protein [Sphaerochaetaceae bacterium]